MGTLSQYFISHLNEVASNLAFLVVAMIGAGVSHVFFQLPATNIRPLLKRMLPDTNDATIEILQFLTVTVIGGFTAMFLLLPKGTTAAFLGGFSWHTTLNKITRTTRRRAG